MSDDKPTTIQVRQTTLARFKHLMRGDETNEAFLIRLMDEHEERET
jgi:hypothetical protein